MNILDVLLIVLLVCVLLSLFDRISLDYRMRQILYIVFAVFIFLWILGLLGVLPAGFGHRLGSGS